MIEPVRARVIVSGRVQGVFFRQGTVAEARARRVGGWVRNRDDGTVECLFEGPRAEVDAMVDWCRTGPPAARVNRVEVASFERLAGLPDDVFRVVS